MKKLNAATTASKASAPSKTHATTNKKVRAATAKKAKRTAVKKERHLRNQFLSSLQQDNLEDINSSDREARLASRKLLSKKSRCHQSYKP